MGTMRGASLCDYAPTRDHPSLPDFYMPGPAHVAESQCPRLRDKQARQAEKDTRPVVALEEKRVLRIAATLVYNMVQVGLQAQ